MKRPLALKTWQLWKPTLPAGFCLSRKSVCFATDFNLIYLSLEGEYSLSNLADDIRFVAQQMPNDVATR